MGRITLKRQQLFRNIPLPRTMMQFCFLSFSQPCASSQAKSFFFRRALANTSFGGLAFVGIIVHIYGPRTAQHVLRPSAVDRSKSDDLVPYFHAQSMGKRRHMGGFFFLAHRLIQIVTVHGTVTERLRGSPVQDFGRSAGAWQRPTPKIKCQNAQLPPKRRAVRKVHFFLVANQ